MGATIGRDVFIGLDTVIDEGFAPLLTIEDGAVISARTFIVLHDSAFNNTCGLPIKVVGLQSSSRLTSGSIRQFYVG